MNELLAMVLFFSCGDGTQEIYKEPNPVQDVMAQEIVRRIKEDRNGNFIITKPAEVSKTGRAVDCRLNKLEFNDFRSGKHVRSVVF